MVLVGEDVMINDAKKSVLITHPPSLIFEIIVPWACLWRKSDEQ